MNTSRLKALIQELLVAEEELKIQDRLKELQDALNKLVAEPQNKDTQVDVSNRLNTLATSVASLKDRWEPAQLEDLRSIGALEFFGDEMVETFRQAMVENPMTPAVVQQQVQQYHKRRQRYVELLQSSNKDLEGLGIGAEHLDEGTAEIGFRIPRELFDNELEGLIEELRVVKRILRAFSELAVGGAEPIYVKQISTTDPLFFFGLAPVTIAMLGKAVTWGLETWKTVEEIRKVRAETSKLKGFSEEEVEKIFGDKIRKTIEVEVEAKAKELVGTDKPKGREAEQFTDLKWALSSLFARIERGMTVEIHFLAPPAPADAEELEPDDQKVREAFEEMRAIAPRLSFPAPDPDPVLRLPPSQPPSEAKEEDGGEAKEKAPRKKT